MNFDVLLRVTEADLDHEYGHLHHAEICRLLERGRILFLEKVGCPQDELIAQDCFLVLTAMNLTFLREVKAGEIRVTCRAEGNGSQLVIHQELVKPPRRTAVEARFELLAISGKSRRKRELPRVLKDALG